MKKILLFLSVTTSLNCVGQEYFVQEPIYLKGKSAIFQHIGQSFRTPPNSSSREANSLIYCAARINKLGTIDSAWVFFGGYNEINNQIIPVISSLGNWSPGSVNGKAEEFVGMLILSISNNGEMLTLQSSRFDPVKKTFPNTFVIGLYQLQNNSTNSSANPSISGYSQASRPTIDHYGLINEGNALFDEGKYALALKKFNAARRGDPSNHDIRLKRALCFLKLENSKTACKEFKKLAADGNQEAKILLERNCKK